jgi:hypothetical protein
MKKTTLLMLCALLLCSCIPEIQMPPEWSSSSTDDKNYCSSSLASSSSIPLPSSSSIPLPSSSGTLLPKSSNSTYGSSSSIADGSDLVRKNIVLSLTGNSYADIDGNIATYNQANAATASKRDKIDLIAQNNSIYSPWEIDLFWSDDYGYLGSEEVSFLEIPNEQADIFKTATNLSQIMPTVNNLIEDIGYFVDEIFIEEGKVFLVNTSENETCIVIIKAAGAQSVNLEIIQVPL